ncbi:hypothetical protein NP233_g11287 [Leucocoprinus birnbaumii]|uniref:Major facilitator superfamily (MFS) profile domain-containing protein n=1 Tax=Leucocoprinus birnbaumii TaxID=56174 RepID=A0AAD5YR39_9AGAR|nr:hypothetical protein NP233_g11287 [Leucocoprinus birnbaumii]
MPDLDESPQATTQTEDNLIYERFSTARKRFLVLVVSSCGLLAPGSMGVGFAKNAPQLMGARFFQSAGAAPAMALGAGVIADIYKTEQRGTALGIFFGATLLGPALVPFVGGLTTQYFSWRVLQVALGVFAALGLNCILFALPETSHLGTIKIDTHEHRSKPRWRSALINPLSPLWLLRSPPLFILTMVGLVSLLTDYSIKPVLFQPSDWPFSDRVFSSTTSSLEVREPDTTSKMRPSLGSVISPQESEISWAPVVGRLSDMILTRYRAKRGFLHPEDRLTACLVEALVLVPLSVFLSGILTRYVSGTKGLVLNLICPFINGVGVDLVLSPSAAYIVDILRSRSAEAMAANNVLRAFILAFTVAGILPLIDSCGIVIADLTSALLGWVGFALLLVTIRYGERMRKWLDVGYSRY